MRGGAGRGRVAAPAATRFRKRNKETLTKHRQPLSHAGAGVYLNKLTYDLIDCVYLQVAQTYSLQVLRGLLRKWRLPTYNAHICPVSAVLPPH